MQNDRRSHWDTIYQKAYIPQLGWYEAVPEPSLQLIESCQLNQDAVQLHVGAGATTLVDQLLAQGFQNLIVNDISAPALEHLKQRLGKEAQKVSWVVDDLLHPQKLTTLGPVDLWHDRAVLHFFCEQQEQDAYFQLLKSMVHSGTYVILATFNLKGAMKCSGLPVYRYDQDMLAEKMGSDFQLLRAFDYTYTMPSGTEREYIYTLFQCR